MNYTIRFMAQTPTGYIGMPGQYRGKQDTDFKHARIWHRYSGAKKAAGGHEVVPIICVEATMEAYYALGIDVAPE